MSNSEIYALLEKIDLKLGSIDRINKELDAMLADTTNTIRDATAEMAEAHRIFNCRMETMKRTGLPYDDGIRTYG